MAKASQGFILVLNTNSSFNRSASPAAVNNSLLEEKKSELPEVFGRSGPTTEEWVYGW